MSEHASQPAYAAGLGQHLERTPAVQQLASRQARCAGTVTKVGTSKVAVAAVVERATDARSAPREGARVVSRVQPLGKRGLRQVLGVIGAQMTEGCRAGWYRVQLSTLPNGTTGWVPARKVRTYHVTSRIVVDLSERRLRLYRSGVLVLQAGVAIGASTTPTPRGRFFVNERYVLPDAGGPFGARALGISAHSEALQQRWVENGPIAIHGTNAARSIGRAVSHGCVRLANDVILRLFPLAPAGTPVVITA